MPNVGVDVVVAALAVLPIRGKIAETARRRTKTVVITNLEFVCLFIFASPYWVQYRELPPS
jgi:hypothetical protein